MVMNRNMKILLQKNGIQVPVSLVSLNNNLKNIADSKLIEVEGCYFLEALFHEEYDIKKALEQDDRTGLECEINNLNIQMVVYTGSCTDIADATIVLNQGIQYAYYLAKKLELVGNFRIILSFAFEKSPLCYINSCVRFHLVRAGENWLSENLDGYIDEAILVLNT